MTFSEIVFFNTNIFGLFGFTKLIYQSIVVMNLFLLY